MPLRVDAAFHGPYGILGAAVAAAGIEDSSGLRRELLRYCLNLNVLMVAQHLGISYDAARDLIIDVLQALPRRV